MAPGCLPIGLFFVLLLVLPFLFAEVLTAAMLKLRLAPEAALLLVLGIFVGSAVNIPVKRIVRNEDVLVHPLGILGMFGFWPQLQRVRRETIIAVNVGGCVIPAGLAVYETVLVFLQGLQLAGALGLSILINTAVCHWIAKPVKGIGIAMPGFVPPIVAVLSATVLAPEERVSVAFVSGVLGPLIGADLLNLREIPRISTGLASIGGAGTFDGIVLSGIVAAYLA